MIILYLAGVASLLCQDHGMQLIFEEGNSLSNISIAGCNSYVVENHTISLNFSNCIANITQLEDVIIQVYCFFFKLSIKYRYLGVCIDTKMSNNISCLNVQMFNEKEEYRISMYTSYVTKWKSDLVDHNPI